LSNKPLQHQATNSVNEINSLAKIGVRALLWLMVNFCE
jgi:hypothetical protein